MMPEVVIRGTTVSASIVIEPRPQAKIKPVEKGEGVETPAEAPKEESKENPASETAK